VSVVLATACGASVGLAFSGVLIPLLGLGEYIRLAVPGLYMELVVLDVCNAPAVPGASIGPAVLGVGFDLPFFGPGWPLRESHKTSHP
jgi:hypothetical protein